MSRLAVGIVLMIAPLDNLEGKLDNILNTYVQEPVKEKMLSTLGPEFCKDAG